MKLLPLPVRTLGTLLLLWGAFDIAASLLAQPWLRLAFLVLGVATPLVLAWSSGPPTSSPLPPEESVPLRHFLPPLGLAAALRLWALRDFSSWPLTDEGMGAFYAHRLSQGDGLRWFYDFCESPPLEVWSLGGWFHLFGSSRASLAAFAAFLSLLTWAAGTWALDRWAGRRGALLGAWALAVSFPFLLMGRLALSVSMLLPWLFLLMGSLAPSPRPRRLLIEAGVGILAALGPFIFHQGLLAFVWALTLYATRSWRSRDPRPLTAFLGGALPTLAPLLLAMRQEGFGGYWSSLLGTTPDLGERLFRSISYFATLWVGPLVPTGHSYEPLGGGYWDPFSGAMVWVALMTWTSRRRLPSWGALAWLALLLALPAFLSADVEPLRLLPLSLPALVLGVEGYRSLTAGWTPATRRTWGAVFLTFALAWNVHHLFGTYRGIWGPEGVWESASKNRQDAEAFFTSARLSREQGPAPLLAGFLPSDRGRFTLFFVSTELPSLALPSEVSLLTRPWEVPLLEGTLPGGKAIDLSAIPPGESLCLYRAPMEAERWERWKEVHEAFVKLQEDRISDPRALHAEGRALAFVAWLPRVPREPYLTNRLLLAAAEEYRLAIVGDVTRFGADPQAQARRRTWRATRRGLLDAALRLVPEASRELDPAFP